MLLSLGAFTGCEPPAPPVIEVTTTAAGPDATPGDGVCEMTTGAGDCSIEAAVQEGNALGRADIQVPAGDHHVPAITITGGISITGTGDFYGRSPTTLNGGPIDVAPGGTLRVASVALTTQLSIEGLFAARSVYMFWTTTVGPQPGPRVQVHADGVAYLENTIVPHTFGLQGAVHNSGVVVLNYSTLSAHILSGDLPEPALHNDGIVHSSASYLDGCSGTPPVSEGYNAASDDSCALDAPSDIESVEVAYRNHPSFMNQYFIPLLRVGSPLLDAIPEGVMGCGTTVTEDMHLDARPYDGDGDGTAECDIGTREEFAYP